MSRYIWYQPDIGTMLQKRKKKKKKKINICSVIKHRTKSWRPSFFSFSDCFIFPQTQAFGNTGLFCLFVCFSGWMKSESELRFTLLCYDFGPQDTDQCYASWKGLGVKRLRFYLFLHKWLVNVSVPQFSSTKADSYCMCNIRLFIVFD